MARRSPEIDAIHAALSADVRRALEAIRRAVHAAAPGAEECLSYGMPAVRFEGRPLVAWRAAASHCAFHPLSGQTVAACADHLGDYRTAPGTIRFTPATVLPPSLVKRLVEHRIAENRALHGSAVAPASTPKTVRKTPAGRTAKKSSAAAPRRRASKSANERAGARKAAPRAARKKPS